MSRIGIRIRLTLPFAVAMAIVLVATGAFVYVRVGNQLLASVDTNLRGQLAEVESNARGEHHALIDEDASEGPTVAAVELLSGAVLTRTPSTLAPLPVQSNVRGTVLFTTTVPHLRGNWRVAERPTTLAGRRVVVIVARSLAARDETLDKLARGFALAVPAALLLAILAGYGLAAAALRPVEAMRRRAAAVSAHEPGRRLPVPPARDEIRALAVTLNDMLDRLEAAFEHERRFLSDASHELRTPLALLRAELDLALRRPRSRAELESAIRSAAEEADRLTQLAEDLLLVARADQGRLPIRLEEVTTADLLSDVRERFASRAQQLGRPLRVTDSTATVARVDPLRIEQALGNLVDNALQHGAGAVQLRDDVRNGSVELHVLDDGPGFPPGFTERAFDRFSRADDARGSGGTGLGLSIVALIARAHGGDAHAANRPGGGCDVWITVPRQS
jgi:signal transduction histidine kinase